MKRMDSNIRKTDVELSVELARGKITAREVGDLKVGDVIQLNTTPTEEAVIRVEGTPKYKGFVGTSTGSRAIKVMGAILDPDEIR